MTVTSQGLLVKRPGTAGPLSVRWSHEQTRHGSICAVYSSAALVSADFIDERHDQIE